MIPERWARFTAALHNPPSLTSTDEGRRNEAKEYIEKVLPVMSPSSKVLLLGCGDGYEIEMLQVFGIDNVTGVTNNLEEAKKCRRSVIVADVHELPFDDGRFDVVISKETLEHFLSPFIALWEINRVSKMGARFVHYIPTGAYKQREWYHLNCVPDYVWVDLFRKTGWKVERISHDIQQIRYEGRKVAEFSDDFQVELYDLEALTASLYEDRVPLQPTRETE